MSARLVKQQLHTLLSGGLLAPQEVKVIHPPAPSFGVTLLALRVHSAHVNSAWSSLTVQGAGIRTTKSGSKVQKPAKKERLRQKRKRAAAAAAAAASTDDTETLIERNLQYYVETAKADAEIKKLMRKVPLLPKPPVSGPSRHSTAIRRHTQHVALATGGLSRALVDPRTAACELCDA